jgi:DNA-binding LacI/PurR family transcriptional regulator
MPDDDPLVAAALGRQPVAIADGPEREDVPFVGIDDEDMARAAAEHLLALGHRRFAVASIGFTPVVEGGLADLERQAEATYRPVRARLRGYRAAIEAAGLAWEGVPVYECAGNGPADGEAAARVLLSRNSRPTAVLAVTDRLAFGVLEAARGAGLSVPGDLSVVGFDDIPEAARANPPLTTVYQPHVEKGISTGRLLIERLRDASKPDEKVLLTARLVVRGSTAAPGTTVRR